ncbi:serine/threonine protein kinase, partial [Streptomyces sp. SID4985]|nr:serine/threonine protein kinase [Streptomyces sp. SID4985]
RPSGAPRPGSARHRAAARRRKLTLTIAGTVLAAAIGYGVWATSTDDTPPQDTQTTSSP